MGVRYLGDDFYWFSAEADLFQLGDDDLSQLEADFFRLVGDFPGSAGTLPVSVITFFGSNFSGSVGTFKGPAPTFTN